MVFANYKPSKNNEKLLSKDEEQDFRKLLNCIIEFNEAYKE